MQDIRAIDDKLNEMTKAGKILDALEQFYDPECTFQEGNQPVRKGRKAQHDHLSNFFATLKRFNGATLHAQGVGTDTTITEWTFDMVGPKPLEVIAQSGLGRQRHRRQREGAAEPDVLNQGSEGQRGNLGEMTLKPAPAAAGSEGEVVHEIKRQVHASLAYEGPCQ